MEITLNKLLTHQIIRHFGAINNLPDELSGLIRDISNTYENFEDATQQLQNSIEISSQELRDAFKKHKDDAETYQRNIDKIKDAIFLTNLSVNSGFFDGETISSSSILLFESLIKLIEERKQLDLTLRDSKTLLRLITDYAQDAIIVIDPKGIISYWNPAAENILGYTRAESIGKNLPNFILPPRYYEEHNASFSLFQQTGHGNAVSKTLDLEARRKDGTEIFVQLTLSTIYMNGGWNAVCLLRDITERKIVEEKLRDSEQNTVALLEAIPEMIFILDAEYNFVEYKPGIDKELAMPKELYLGKNIIEVLPESLTTLLKINVDSILRNEQVKPIQYQMPFDGEMGFYECKTSPFGDSMVLTVIRNITEQKQAEERMRKLTDCLLGFGGDMNLNINSLVALCGETLGATCAIYNRLDGGMLCSRGQWQTPSDYKSVDMPDGHICYDVIKLSKNDPLVVHDLQRTDYMLSDPNVLAYHLQTYIGVAVKCHNLAVGSLCVVYQNDVNLSQELLNFLGIIGFAVSIEEERKLSEEALHQSSEKWEAIVAASPDGIGTVSIDGKIQVISKKLAAMHGYSVEQKDEYINKTIFDFIDPSNHQMLIDNMGKLLAGENDHKIREYIAIKKDSSRFYVEVNSTVLYDQKGKPVSIVFVERDITENKRIEADLTQSADRLAIATKAGCVGIWDYDVPNNTLSWDDQMYSLYGITDNQFGGVYEAWRAGVHPDDVVRGDEEIQMALRGEKDFDTVFRVVWPDETIHNIRALAIVQRDSFGQAIRMIGTNWDITAQKQSEQAIRESETNFHSFFETIDDMIFIANQNGEIFFTNSSVFRKLGYSTEDLQQMHVLDVHPKAKRDEAQMIFGDMFAGKRECCPLPLVKKDGSFLPVETRVWFGMWDGKECIFGISKDLSKEQESLQKFNKIFDNNPALMAISSIPERVFTEVNQAFISKTGYSKEEIIGKTSGDLGLFFQQDIQNEIADKLSKTGLIYNSELKVRTKTGNILDGLFSGEIIESQGKKYFLTVMVDISENKKLEEEIKLQNSFYNIVSTISGNLIQSNSENLDAEINHSLELLGIFNLVDRSYIFELDIAKDELNNTFEWCADGIIPEIDNLQGIPFSFIPLWKETFLKNEHIYIQSVGDLPEKRHYEKEILEQQGIQSLVTVPMFYGTSLIGFIGFDSVNDKKEWNQQVIILLKIYASVLGGVIYKKQTEALLLKARKEADTANESKSEFLANMSHEIRTPLNGVIGFADLLQKTSLNRIQRQYAENVNTSGHALLGIINDILDFSKIEAGKMEFDFIKTDIIELVEHASDIIKYHASKKGLELLLNMQPDMPRFAVLDSIRLKQILVNLLSNAVKFTECGEVELKVTFVKEDAISGKFSFSVRDTGIGINDDQQKKLFKSFAQADSSTSRKFGGTGLGLSISNMLAEKMGSKIELISEPGKGSDFFFTIETEYEVGEKIHTVSLAEIKRVLVIDDNDNNRMILEHTFNSWGIECVGINNGLSAIKILEKSRPFDVIIVDYHMPYQNGINTIRMIREQLNLTAEKQHVILLHSSSDDIEIYDECKKLGVRYNLIKPVKSQELLHYLENINNKPTLEEKENENVANEVTIELVNDSSPLIMVAEDVPLNMLLVTTIITQMLPNVKIVEAKNGKEAFDIAMSKKPDLILMDVQMPEMSGIEATVEIRKYETKKACRVPIIALTAGAVKGEKEKCLSAGMDDFLTKPIEQNALRKILKKYLASFAQQINNSLEKNSQNSTYIHFDKTLLMENINQNHTVFKELLELIPVQFSHDITSLGKAIDEKNVERIRKSAHSIKGASLGMCFYRMADLAIEIEVSADNESLHKIGIKYN